MPTPKKATGERRRNHGRTEHDDLLVKARLRHYVSPLFEMSVDGSDPLATSTLAREAAVIIDGNDADWDNYRRIFDYIRTEPRVSDPRTMYVFGHCIGNHISESVNGPTVLFSCGHHRDFAGVIVNWVWIEPIERRRDLIREMLQALPRLLDLDTGMFIDPFAEFPTPWIFSPERSATTLRAWQSWVERRGVTFDSSHDRHPKESLLRFNAAQCEALGHIDRVASNALITIPVRQKLVLDALMEWLREHDRAIENFENEYRDRFEHRDPETDLSELYRSLGLAPNEDG